MDRSVWGVCASPPGDPTYGAWNELGAHLAGRGVRLKLFHLLPGNYGLSENFDQEVVGGYPNMETWPLAAYSAGGELAYEIARTDLAWAGAHHTRMSAKPAANVSAIEDPLSRRGLDLIGKLCAGWQERMLRDQPCAILPWGTSVTLSRLFLRLAERHNFPRWIFERGPLPGSLEFSTQGNCAINSVNSDPACLDYSVEDEILLARFARVADYYKNNRRSHYPDDNRSPTDAEETRLLSKPGKRVLFLGSFDIGTLGLANLGAGPSYANFFRTSSEALRITAGTLRTVDPQAILWVKHHPSHPLDLPLDAGISVEKVGEFNLDWLFERADMIVSIVSTTQVHALLYEKPQVVLAAGPLLGHGIAYECYEEYTVADGIRDALDRNDFEFRRLKGRAYVGMIFERFLVGTDATVPAKLTLADIARMISRFAPFYRRAHSGAASSTTLFEVSRAAAEAKASYDAASAIPGPLSIELKGKVPELWPPPQPVNRSMLYRAKRALLSESQIKMLSINGLQKLLARRARS